MTPAYPSSTSSYSRFEIAFDLYLTSQYSASYATGMLCASTGASISNAGRWALSLSSAGAWDWTGHGGGMFVSYFSHNPTRNVWHQIAFSADWSTSSPGLELTVGGASQTETKEPTLLSNFTQSNFQAFASAMSQALTIGYRADTNVHASNLQVRNLVVRFM